MARVSCWAIKEESTVYISCHLEKNGVLSPAPFVHCASHNLNLVVNDAVESNVLSVSFFGVLAETFSFFLTEVLIDPLILRSLAASTSSRIGST